MDLKNKLKILRQNKLSVVDNAKYFLKKIKKEDGKINAFIDVRPDLVLKRAKYLDYNRKRLKKCKLFGLCVAVKAAINVKDYIISCASKTLEDYKGTFNATVIDNIEKEGGLVIGMTNCDEFCSGVSGETSAFGATKNPRALNRIPGGSSSGSAAAVAAGFCDVALGSDTGGSIRSPASNCGVVGVKPSYGLVSRYGLIDLSMSLDVIGPIGRNVEDCALVLDVISGVDGKDTTTTTFRKSSRSQKQSGKVGKVKVGVVRVKGVDKRIQKLVDEKVKEMKGKGWEVREVDIKHIDLAVQTYYPIVFTEFFSGTRKFDGRKYGKKIEDSCGEEVLRRILGGAEITKAEYKGAYYRKALGVKRMIAEEFERVLGKVDCLVMPVSPVLPWELGKKVKTADSYFADALTSPINLAGICSVSVPVGEIREKEDVIPVGMQVVCGKGEEGKMLGIASTVSG